MRLHDWTRVDPNEYHDFHQAWITFLRTALNTGVLPAGYRAISDYTVQPFVPDVLTLTRGRGGRGRAQASDVGMGVKATPPQVAVTRNGRVRRARPGRRRVVVWADEGERLVAVIELVSPGNKARRREFFDLLDKAVTLLSDGVHLLLIDPFPPTARDPHGLHAAVWKEMVDEGYEPPADKPLTVAAYAARGRGKYTAYVQPIAAGDELPEMPLFLTPDRYVNVPLGPTYAEARRGYGFKELLEPPG